VLAGGWGAPGICPLHFLGENQNFKNNEVYQMLT
jgi:hypothetical protein